MEKAPMMLVVLVETARLRWFVAAVGLDGQAFPLVCSEAGDLDKYRTLDFDEQLAFLRHRFCGVLQRGCDRVWARNGKACQFVFVFEGPLPEPTGTLTQALAEHFTVWLLNPPVAIFNLADSSGPDTAVRLEKLAGELAAPLEPLLHTHLGGLLAARQDPTRWELTPRKTG
jgi:hypothetical protein